MSNAARHAEFRVEELAAQRTAAIGRTVAMAAIAVMLTVLTPWPAPVYYYFTLSTFVAFGWVAYGTARSSWGRPWHQYIFVVVDFTLLTFVICYPNPLSPDDIPPQLALHGDSFKYFYVLLAGLTYIYQARLVLWGGVAACAAWMTGVGIVIARPETVWRLAPNETLDGYMRDLANPFFVNVNFRIQEVLVFLIVAALLALAVKRARTIALRQIKLAQQKNNLARYFPRKTVEILANKTDALSQPREHNAAVLFTDLVGFTTWSERHSPAEVIELLREVQSLITAIVFRHDGTLEKFMGDGVMATFGTPSPTDHDASNALAAAIEISAAFEEFRLSKPVGEGRNLKLAVGAHYGPIVLGDVGTEQRLEFAVLGDTVNVASRLEQATRPSGCMGLVSADLVNAAVLEDREGVQNAKTQLSEIAPIQLRGRDAMTQVFAI